MVSGTSWLFKSYLYFHLLVDAWKLISKEACNSEKWGHPKCRCKCFGLLWLYLLTNVFLILILILIFFCFFLLHVKLFVKMQSFLLHILSFIFCDWIYDSTLHLWSARFWYENIIYNYTATGQSMYHGIAIFRFGVLIGFINHYICNLCCIAIRIQKRVIWIF